MRTLIVFLCMAGAALAQQRRQQEPPATDRAALGKVKKDQIVDVSIRSGTEISYDDNILDLNNKQIKQLESGTRPEKFKIDDPEDFVYSVYAELRLKGRFIGDTTHASLKIQPYWYQSSSIANYEEFELSVRQDLGKHEAGIEYEFDHDVYLRELKNTVTTPSFITTTTWESARYNEHNAEGFYRHQLVTAVSVRGSAGYRMKDFNALFGYRDIEGFFVSVGPVVEIGNDYKAFVRYEYSDMESEASRWEIDTSYRQHELEVGGSAEFFRMLDLSIKYRVGFREYTTGNGPAVDPSHAEREDVRHKVHVRAKLKLSKSLSLHVEYVYRHDDSHRPFDDDATTSEPGNSTRNVVTIGATFTF